MKPAEPDFDLPRLDAATQPQLCEAIATLRSHGPDATELASLASRLALAGIDVTLPAPTPPRASLRWKKWAAGGGAASGALILLFSSVKPAPPPAANPRAPSPTFEVQARAQAPHGAVSAGSRAKSPTAQTPIIPSPLSGEPLQPTPRPTREDEQVPAGAREAVADSREQAALRPPSAAERTQSHTPFKDPTRAASSAQAETPELRAAAPSEIELLRDARLALKQAPARALTLVEAHTRAYPAGKLTQERELIGISALVALGRRTAALSRGARFQHDFPSSPYRDQVQQLLR